MSPYGYTQYLPGVMNLLNNYFVESVNNINSSNNPSKHQTGSAFDKNQEKDVK